MKISVSLIFCLLLSILTHEQLNTGQKMIGWQLDVSVYNNNLGTSSSSEQHASNFFTSVSFSKFKSPTLFTGLGITYSYNYNHTGIGTTNAEHIERSQGIGLFVTGTKLLPLAKKCYVGFTGTGGGQYGYGKTTYTLNNTTSDGRSYTVYANGILGVFYHLNQRFLLNTNLINLISLNFFSNRLGSGAGEVRSNNFTLSSGFNGFSLNNVGIGVRYLLK
jgi:hypothetical protein